MNAEGNAVLESYDRAKPVLDGQRARLLAGLEELSPATAISTFNAATDWARMEDEEKRLVIRQYRIRIEVAPKLPGTLPA